MGKFSIWLCTAFAALAMWATPANADSITYKFEGFATATIGIAGSHTSAFTLTMDADTDDIFPTPFGLSVPVENVFITFDGWGTVEILTPMRMRTSESGASKLGGPVRASDGFFVFAMVNPEWDTYDLEENLTLFDADPINQSAIVPLALSIPGDLEFVRLGDVTFTASRVPEPASMALFAIGGGLVYWRRRRQRA